MWNPDNKEARQYNFAHAMSIFAGFLVGSTLAIFGVWIGYAISIGIAASVVAFFLAFRRFDETG